VMNITTKSQLNILIKEFKSLQTDSDSLTFAPKWRTFYDNLSQEDAIIATTAWMNAIYENLSEIKKLVEKMSDDEKHEFANFFTDLENHPFFQRTYRRAE
jgi:hypothetical protein